MKETSTPFSKSTKSHTGVVSSSPRQSTLAFLRGFARAYSVDPRLQPGLNTLILN